MLLLLLAAVDLTAFTAATQPSIVLLQTVDDSGQTTGSGTGFFISADGRIATNHHVIDGARRARAVLSDGRKLDVAGLVVDDPDHDLAIVKVEGTGFPALRLGAALGLQPGVPIAIVGHPLGMSASVADGTIAAVRAEMPAHLDVRVKGEIVQLNAMIAHGNSGSPVQTMDGLVVGIATFMIDGLAFAVPVERLRELSARAPAGAKLSTLADPGTARNWLISAVLAAAAALALAIHRAVQARSAKRAAQRALVKMRN